MIHRVFIALLLTFFATSSQAADLLMVEESGCYWCAKWNAEIGPTYEKTAEGKFAPLIRVNIRKLPANITFKKAIVYTPTFILTEDNKEIARLEGYPGEDFFWPMLNKMLKQSTIFEDGAS